MALVGGGEEFVSISFNLSVFRIRVFGGDVGAAIISNGGASGTWEGGDVIAAAIFSSGHRLAVG